MSRINAIRLINLNYNNNRIRIIDESFHLNGESTLFTLRNGGGKSVLVQMLMAPFVHKRYRDADNGKDNEKDNEKKRKFSEYFTSNKPSFILVEWKLDGNSGYVLTGMMIRKSQEISDSEQQDDLDIIQFIHEYKTENLYDINSIPFTKTQASKKTFLTYGECEELLGSLKMSKTFNFFVYNMNNSNQSRNYFNKLSEYQIYYKEWETIIKKINKKESGLSDLFTKARSEVGLMEEWFLSTVEDKLNKDKDRIKEFRDILDKYIGQYKYNKLSIDRKNNILLLKEESKDLLNMAENLKKAREKKYGLENKIANLIDKLNSYMEGLELYRVSLEQEEVALGEDINNIKYQELSFSIHTLKDEYKKLYTKDLELQDFIRELNKEINLLRRKQAIENCVKINEAYQDESQELKLWDNRYELAKNKEKDKRSEIEALGYSLRHYYENKARLIKDTLKALEKTILEIEEEEKSQEKELDRLQEKERDESSYFSSLNTKILAYDDLEKHFNELYGENLSRNLFNKYGPNGLEDRIKETEERTEEVVLEKLNLENSHRYEKESLELVRRKIEEKIKEDASLGEKILAIEKDLREINLRIETRKSLIKHIGFGEEKIFHTEDILREFKERKNKVSQDIRKMEIGLRDLKSEYHKIESGQIMELPKNIKEGLNRIGINYVYGMDWLKRNDKTLIENKKVVENNPFIPYGLILTLEDMQRLKNSNLELYSSFPIPLVIRESLEDDCKEDKSPVFPMDKISFYILFNQDLLDTREVDRILSSKAGEIENTKEALLIKKSDLKEYEERYNLIFHQDLREGDYKDRKARLSWKLTAKAKAEEDLEALRQDEAKSRSDLEQLMDEINMCEKELDRLGQKKKDLKNLNKEYNSTLELINKRSKTKDNISKIKSDSGLIKEKIKSLRQGYRDKSKSRDELSNKEKVIGEKLNKYLKYRPQELIQKDIDDLVARYQALTVEISSELKDIEENLSKAQKRYDREKNNLIEAARHYKIKEEEYETRIYDEFLLAEIEKEVLDLEVKLKDVDEKASDIRKKIAVKEDRITREVKKLKEVFKKEKPAAKGEIGLINFNKARLEKEGEINKIKTRLNSIVNRISSVKTNYSSLSNYYDLAITEDIKFNFDLILREGEGLDKFREDMIRDHRLAEDDLNQLKNKLYRAIDNQLRKGEFQEDFFSKPLNILYKLIGEPEGFIQQLSTTLLAYEDLMRKLDADISLINKEKDRIVYMLLEYIADIHRYLSKIDRNSTIKIRDKSVKMLTIDLPNWDLEEDRYRERLENMIEELIQSGINQLEKNENIGEIISSIITTNNLYNTVVGINNVVIKLYKVEAEKQYQINWSEVARNSGGEGFLSAFVILSSLLSFMRRDDSDIFADSKEGKTLIMDNPFAQTNSTHLLKPLMDIAKKSHTQLICFTALSGEEIYNSFDNVYVLNTITPQLMEGTEYLKGYHKKGEDIETILASQIKIEEMEQLDLLS